MANVEIYIENTDEESVLEWIATFTEGVTEVDRDDGMVVYSGIFEKSVIPIIIQKQVEDKNIIGVWFNSEITPWKTDADCARSAFKWFNTTIQCDPGSQYPHPYQFLEISVEGEKIIEIKNDLIP